MKKRVSFILVVVLLFSFYSKVSASELCSPDGYTILTVNGIFTSEKEAVANKKSLQSNFSSTYNNQPLKVDYLYNPTHLAGAGDLIDSIAQGVFDQKSDYDLTEMLNDASHKVTTQKLLLVAHSQGNFYANNFYDKTASQPGGVPSQSIGVYSIASPADHVAGGGNYVTSDTDKVISSVVGHLINILPPNIHIPLQNGDDKYGHSFTDVYLKYQSDRIVSDIQSSLNSLQTNDEQDSQDPCISPPELSVAHKVEGVLLAVADPTANVVKTGIVDTYDTGVYVAHGAYKAIATVGNILRGTTVAIGNAFSGLSASVIESVPDASSLTTILPDISEPAQDTASIAQGNISPQEQNLTEPVDVQLADSNIDALPLLENKTPTQIETITPSLGVDIVAEDPIKQNSEVVALAEPIVKIDVPFVYSAGGGSVGSGGVVTPPVDTDTTAPVITILGENPLSININTIYADLGATATDDKDVTVNVVTTGSVDTSVVGVYTVTYTASDLAGNTATLTRTVNVVALPVDNNVNNNNNASNNGSNNSNNNPAPNQNDRVINSDTTFSAGEYNFNNLTITNNAKLTLDSSPDSSDSFKGVKINAVNITIEQGSSISADGKGYQDGPGIPSATNYYAGASYGGVGIINELTSTYGSAKEPIDLGSGGTNTYRGGGAIRLVVTGNIVNNGTVSSNGEYTSSGGSIYVTANDISGNGTFNANGGGFYFGGNAYGAGGGGRIALYYKTSSFVGKTESFGGCGSTDGNMTSTCAKNGTVGFFDTLNNNLYVDGSWVFQKNDGPFNFNHIVLTNGSVVTSEKEANITANDILVDKASSFTLAENQIINIPSVSINNGSTLNLSGSETLTVNNLNVKGNSVVTIIPEKILSLTIPNITIDSGSSINTNAKGFGGSSGPGASSKTYDPNNPNLYLAGASYGGVGFWNSSSSIYGSSTEPVDFGSSGNGNSARGGGAIRLIVTGNLINNGIISANGNNTSSGGSIYVTANALNGTGSFQANGGTSYCPSSCYGPGGGGRIAVYYQTSSFTGTTVADGWNGYGGTSEVGTVHVVDELAPPAPIKSSLKVITIFNFNSLSPNVAGVIDETAHNISLTIPFGTDVTNLIPTITFSDKASVSPNSDIAQNFTSSVVYTVTAEDNSTQTYTVSVIVSNPPPDTTPPSVLSYDLNGYKSDITINPSQSNPTMFTINASEKVNWMSIKIEKEDDPNFYKIFQSGSGCTDNTNSCQKIWFGELSSGGLLQSGRYRIKLHMKDAANNEFYDYLSPYAYIIKTN